MDTIRRTATTASNDNKIGGPRQTPTFPVFVPMDVNEKEWKKDVGSGAGVGARVPCSNCSRSDPRQLTAQATTISNQAQRYSISKFLRSVIQISMQHETNQNLTKYSYTKKYTQFLFKKKWQIQRKCKRLFEAVLFPRVGNASGRARAGHLLFLAPRSFRTTAPGSWW